MNQTILKNAAKAGHSSCYHVAVVVRGGAVLAIGHNHDAVHAEVAALSRLWPDQRPGCKVWSFRVRKNGSYGLARPCEKCQEFLAQNGIKVVHYTDNNGDMQRMKLAGR